MSTIVTAAALEAFLASDTVVSSGAVTLTGAEEMVFVPRLADQIEDLLDLIGSQASVAGLSISAVQAATLQAWLNDVVTCATYLQDQAIAVRLAMNVLPAAPERRTGWARQLTSLRTLFATRTASGVRLTAAEVAGLQESLGELVVCFAELELDVRAWRLRRRAGRTPVRDQSREEAGRASEKAPATPHQQGGEPVSECLGAIAQFFGGYRESGVALAATTAAEFEALFADMAGRSRQLERPQGSVAAVSVVARDPCVWEVVAAAVRAPGSNVTQFPIVRRSPPRDPVPAA